MSNISEQYRRPLMTDETGIAIAEKLGGDTTSEYKINTSAEYRKPPMSDETAQLILAEMSGGASNLSDLNDVTLTNPSDGQVLHYDGSEWINATPVNELPTVTSSDNGSVLGVVEGAWATANPKVYISTYDGTNIPNSLYNIASKVNEGSIVGFYYNKVLYLWNSLYTTGSGMVMVRHDILTAVVFDGTNVKVKIANYYSDQSGTHLDLSEKTITTT